jgi:hypothetical protein
MRVMTNQWIGIVIITLVSTVFVGCNGGGGGGGAPTIDCRLPQNFSNQTCFNARPGNMRPGGPGGRLSVGSYLRSPPSAGVAQLTISNPAYVIALCQRAVDANGGARVQQSSFQANPMVGNGNYTNAGYQQWNNVCMNIGSTVVTFLTEKVATQGNATATTIRWRLYFIPLGVQVAGVPVEQLSAMGPGSAVYSGYVQGAANGGFQANGGDMVFAGIDAGNSFSISILAAPNVVIGSGTMGPSAQQY